MTEETAVVAEKNLDELLADFKEPEAKPEPESKPESKSKTDEMYEWMQSERQEKVNSAMESGITEAVSSLKSDEIKATDRALKGFLYTLADQNPIFGKAFESRLTNPAQWERSLEWAKQEAIKDFPASTDKLTKDIEAAKAGASTQTEPESKPLGNDFWNGLNDGDFRKAKAAYAAGKDPQVAIKK